MLFGDNADLALRQLIYTRYDLDMLLRHIVRYISLQVSTKRLTLILNYSNLRRPRNRRPRPPRWLPGYQAIEIRRSSRRWSSACFMSALRLRGVLFRQRAVLSANGRHLRRQLPKWRTVVWRVF
jgi:hypothetical protein